MYVIELDKPVRDVDDFFPSVIVGVRFKVALIVEMIWLCLVPFELDLSTAVLALGDDVLDIAILPKSD